MLFRYVHDILKHQNIDFFLFRQTWYMDDERVQGYLGDTSFELNSNFEFL